MQYARSIDVPRILIAALRGGSGKTVVSIGIIAALARSGKTVSPFKKGPDYIDAGWLAMAAGRPCHNLDSFLFEDHLVSRSFIDCSKNSDIAVIEGNRGLFDGLDTAGSTSSAALSVLLNAPVLLCVDCTGSTRTMAALVMGCMQFDPKVNIAGVILNRVAGQRHENLLRECIENYCGIPVVGAIPKLPGKDFPERHMGLIPTPEHTWASSSIDSAALMAQKYIDLDAVWQIALDGVEHLPGNPGIYDQIDVPLAVPTETVDQNDFCIPGRPRIGIIMDSAFQFYYPENIKALVDAGADLVYMSPLEMKEMPEIEGLYIGGGFPETHAKALSDNLAFRNAIKSKADEGLPIYAECGGLIYLGDSLVLEQTYPMAGVIPAVFGLSKRPQGHGYTVVTVNRDNPYYPKGTELKGHEFHYSSVITWNGNDSDLVFDMKKGRGFYNCEGTSKDGVCLGNVMATYTHLHALGSTQWALSLVRLAREFKKQHRS